jgi:hypothetical protein
MSKSNAIWALLLATVLASPQVYAQRSESFGQTVTNKNITESDVQAAQEAWEKLSFKSAKILIRKESKKPQQQQTQF